MARVFNEDDRNYLNQIQAVIARMAGNSFTLKGWSVTLVSALLALSGKDTRIVALAVLPILIFWGLDAYYLALERGFRDLSKKFVEGDTTAPVYEFISPNMDWLKAMYQAPVLLLHGALLVITVALFVYWQSIAPTPTL